MEDTLEAPAVRLDPHQQAVVDSRAENLAVVAGPGSGKTRVLVERVRRMVAHGEDPATILVLTFTNAGAGEFRRRLAPVVPGYCGTLHSFLLKLLMTYGYAGVRVCGVMDEQLRSKTLEEVLKELDVKVPAREIAELVADEKAMFPTPGRPMSRPMLAAVEYHRRCRESGLVDFDTVLAYGRRLARSLGDEPPQWWPYRHLLWDEAQDGGAADWDVYASLPVRTRFVVGDPDQSIYSFRGARPETLVAYAEVSGSGTDHELLLLEPNYRSTRQVCDAANRLIAHNGGRVPKTIRPVRDSDGASPVLFLPCDSPGDELCVVLDEVLAFGRQHGLSPGTCAVLARTNRAAGEVAQFLAAKGVSVARPTRPRLPDDWRRTRALLSALAAPHSDRAVMAFLEEAEGPAAAGRAKRSAELAMSSLNDAMGGLFQPKLGRDPHEILADEFAVGRESAELVRELCEGRDPTWGELSDLAAGHGQEEEPGEGHVHVGTVHSAKGREWPLVVVVGCEEGSFPSSKAGTDVEEERRLMFVAATRARDRLVLTFCRQRPAYRGPDIPPGPMQPKAPSRFLEEMGYAG